MARRLADNEIMQRGDWLMVDKVRFQAVDGYDGTIASYWSGARARRESGLDGEYWVETERGETGVVCEVLISGLEKIRRELWTNDY